jgi:hypothetical protein
VSCELHAISRQCRPAKGGASRIVLIDPADLSVQPVYYRVPNVGELEFLPGKSAYLIECDLNTARLTSDTTVNADSGDVFNYRVEARLKTIRLDVEYLRRKLANRRVHAVVTLRNGERYFLPLMRLVFNSASGDALRSINAYTLVATGALPYPAPVIEGNLNVTTEGGLIPDVEVPVDPGNTDFEPVVITTTSSSYSYTLPATHLLLAIHVVSNANQTISIGYSTADDLGGPTPMTAGVGMLFGSVMLRPASNTAIVFTGLQGTNTIELWILSQ